MSDATEPMTAEEAVAVYEAVWDACQSRRGKHEVGLLAVATEAAARAERAMLERLCNALGSAAGVRRE